MVIDYEEKKKKWKYVTDEYNTCSYNIDEGMSKDEKDVSYFVKMKSSNELVKNDLCYPLKEKDTSYKEEHIKRGEFCKNKNKIYSDDDNKKKKNEKDLFYDKVDVILNRKSDNDDDWIFSENDENKNKNKNNDGNNKKYDYNYLQNNNNNNNYYYYYNDFYDDEHKSPIPFDFYQEQRQNKSYFLNIHTLNFEAHILHALLKKNKYRLTKYNTDMNNMIYKYLYLYKKKKSLKYKHFNEQSYNNYNKDKTYNCYHTNEKKNTHVDDNKENVSPEQVIHKKMENMYKDDKDKFNKTDETNKLLNITYCNESNKYSYITPDDDDNNNNNNNNNNNKKKKKNNLMDVHFLYMEYFIRKKKLTELTNLYNKYIYNKDNLLYLKKWYLKNVYILNSKGYDENDIRTSDQKNIFEDTNVDNNKKYNINDDINDNISDNINDNINNHVNNHINNICANIHGENSHITYNLSPPSIKTYCLNNYFICLHSKNNEVIILSWKFINIHNLIFFKENDNIDDFFFKQEGPINLNFNYYKYPHYAVIKNDLWKNIKNIHINDMNKLSINTSNCIYIFEIFLCNSKVKYKYLYNYIEKGTFLNKENNISSSLHIKEKKLLYFTPYNIIYLNNNKNIFNSMITVTKDIKFKYKILNISFYKNNVYMVISYFNKITVFKNEAIYFVLQYDKNGDVVFDQEVNEKNKEVNEKNKEINEKNKEVNEKNKEVNEKNKEVNEKNKEMNEKNKEINEKKKEINEKKKEINEKKKEINEQNKDEENEKYEIYNYEKDICINTNEYDKKGEHKEKYNLKGDYISYIPFLGILENNHFCRLLTYCVQLFFLVVWQHSSDKYLPSHLKYKV
nr:conserved Plasmodium membrane protein, unknown function [Plasmodium sp. DRC-Itaito]